MRGHLRRAIIVCGARRHEHGAFMLGAPISEELRSRGVEALVRDVPDNAADVSLESPETYRALRRERKAWWKDLADAGVPVFSLHNYPYGEPSSVRAAAFMACSIFHDGLERGVYVIERVGIERRLGESFAGTALWLVGLRRRGVSPFEDSTLLHASRIDIPAVYKGGTAEVDISRTIEAGFCAKDVVRSIADALEWMIERERICREMRGG
jgi:hypothetical protein